MRADWILFAMLGLIWLAAGGVSLRTSRQAPEVSFESGLEQPTTSMQAMSHDDGELIEESAAGDEWAIGR